MVNDPEKLVELLYELVESRGISGTAEEKIMADKVYSLLENLSYFKQEKPENLKLHKIETDPLGRTFVSALLEGRGNNTVVLLNHFDVVDVEDYGALSETAFKPRELTKKLAGMDLPAEARQDLESQEWIFGRGVMDMKAGLALQIALLEELSRDPASLEGNILFLSVPGEENSSEGMLAAVPFLNYMEQQRGLNYTGLVNCEPLKENEAGEFEISTGTAGKLLPLFYCFGKETHGMVPFQGLNSALLFAQLETVLELNSELSDSYQGVYSMPPTNLKTKDLRRVYNVTTPQVTAGYFNVFSLEQTPGEVLSKLRSLSRQAFQRSIDIYNSRLEEFCQLSGQELEGVDWQPNIYSYQELYNSVLEEHGEEINRHLDSFISDLKEEVMDQREFTLRLIDELHNYCPDRTPKIVIAFAPPYYPKFRNRGESAKEKFMLKVVDRIKQQAQEKYGEKLWVNNCWGINDLSYCGLQDSQDIVENLRPNMPAMGEVYHFPVEDLQKLNLPALIIGPWGKDSHKFTERLHLPFFTEKAPHLLRYTVKELLKY